jgi:hypothetical protein
MLEGRVVRVVLSCSREIFVISPYTVDRKGKYSPLNAESVFQHFDTAHEVNFNILEGATLPF